MTDRDEIIRMAREAGFVIDEKARQHQPNCIFHTHHMIDEGLTRFAALVRADEREACAIAGAAAAMAGKDYVGVAAAIRARGNV